MLLKRLLPALLILSTCFYPAISSAADSNSQTSFGPGAGEYARLFDALKEMLLKEQRTRIYGGQERLIFVSWIRDQIHVSKAMKFLAPEVSSYLEHYLETQTPEGLYFDYVYPLDAGEVSRVNIFDRRYWRIFTKERFQMHRLPVEADLEYLMVEGAYYVWQSTGNREFLEKWLPTLEKGMRYSMRDPLRWSEKFQLVKRGYTIDTWDFMQLPMSRAEYSKRGSDIQKGIFDIGPDTPMGIMHGDNSGMYAACRQLAEMHAALGHDIDARIWTKQAEIFQLRTNQMCWNGRHYAHFVEDDPMPEYLKIDQKNTLSLSNTYDINRGLPTEEMAQSIVQTYLDLKEKTRNESFVEWFGIYPAVQPHYADHEAGSYVNGGVLTLVAGELSKAAFQHGYEEYGADILRRILQLVDKHNGDLPVGFKPDGTVDSGIPDNWGQAAVFSAMVEGLAGVVDRGALFNSVELTPRWIAAGVKQTDVNIKYGPSGKAVKYSYRWDEEKKTIECDVEGDCDSMTFQAMLPKGVEKGRLMVDGQESAVKLEKKREYGYLIAENLKRLPMKIRIEY